MAVAYTNGSASSGKNGTAGSFTFTSVAVSGSNPAIIVKIALVSPPSPGNFTVTNVACSAGLSGTCTEVKNVQIDAGGPGTFLSTWKIVAPSGTGTITVTLSGSTPYQAVYELWSGTDQTDPSPNVDAVTATGVTNPLTATPANLTANDAASGIGANGLDGDAPNFDQTDTYLDNTTNVNCSAGYHLGTGAVSCTWGSVSSVDAFLAVRVKAAGAAAAPFTGSTSDNSFRIDRAQRGFLASAQTTFLGQDKFFGNPGEVLAYNWPNPQRPTPSQAERTYQSLLSTTLAPLSANPFLPSDWPNPRGYSFAADLRSFIDASEVWLIGQDKFFGAAGQVVDFDWPNPTLSRRASQEFVQALLSTTLSPIVVVPPFTSFDWPNPQRQVPLAVTSLTSIFYYIIDDNVPFVPMEFSNPGIRRQPLDLKTWLANLQETTLAVPPVPPFFFTGWTNPLQRQFPIDLRNFLNPAEIQLFGKDQFFGGPGQPPLNIQWPVPKGYVGVIDLKTETLSLLSTTLKPTPAPPGTGHDLILVDGRLAKHISGIIYVFLN